MATIDELVVKFKFDVDEKGLRRLQSLENVTLNAGTGAEKMGNGFEQAGKSIKHSVKSTDALAASFMRIALAAASALSIGKAMQFALGAADEAKELNDLATSLGENSSELNLFGAALRSVGKDSNAFFSDLKGIQRIDPEFSLEDIFKEANRFKKLREDYEKQGKNAVPLVLEEAAARGWSEQIALFLMQGEDAIKEQMEQSRRLGHEISTAQIENSDKVSKSYSRLEETLSSIGRKLTGDLGPSISSALDGITEGLAANQMSIEGWAVSADNTFQGFVDGVTGKLGIAEDAISRFNNKLVSENTNSPDPKVRKSVIDELTERFLGQSSAIGLEALGGVIPHYNPKTGFRWSPIKAIQGAFGKLEIAGTPLHDAAQIDWQMKMGHNLADTGNPMDDWFANYRTYNDLPGRQQEDPTLTELADSTYPNLPVRPTYSPGDFNTRHQGNFERYRYSGIDQPEPSRLEVLSQLDQTPRINSTQNIDRDSVGDVVRQEYENNRILQEMPILPTSHDKELLAALREVMSRWGPPSELASLPMHGINQHSSPDNGGVKVENQNITINIDGGGQSPEAIGRATALELRNAARMADFAPRMR